MGNQELTNNPTTVFHPLNPFDVLQLKTSYPNLQLTRIESGLVCQGNIVIDNTFDGFPIKDMFAISILIMPDYPESIPLVREIGGRTVKLFETNKARIKDILNLHVFPALSNAACLGALNELRHKFPIGSRFDIFITELVVPYFYGLSFFEKKGYWPWGERSHGINGLLEANSEIRNITRNELLDFLNQLRRQAQWTQLVNYVRKMKPKRRCKRHCLCNSKKAFSVCHPKAWEGILKLHSDIKRHKLIHILYQ